MGRQRHRKQFYVVFVTCPNRRVASRIAATVVDRHLAACVNILPGVESVFWWQGKRDRCREVLLLIKTSPRSFESLRRAIVRLHPYEVPEVIGIPIAAGHPPYLAWLASACSRR